MTEIRIRLEHCALEAFLARTVEFLREWTSLEADPTYGIVWVQSIGEVPVFGPESGWDVLHALKEEGKMVFFSFALKDDDGTLTCANGNNCGPASEEEDSEGIMLIGLEDSIGFLVQIKDTTFIINSAIHAGGGCPGPLPSVEPCVDCRGLEEPITKFIESFVDV